MKNDRVNFNEIIAPATAGRQPDLVCLSHLRWDFVYQRPQHLMSRFARSRRVFFIEEPIFGEGQPRLDVTPRGDRLHVVVPRLPHGLNAEAAEAIQKHLIDQLFGGRDIEDYVLWYYTPMAMARTRHLKPLATVYDCMDELSAFKGAPSALREREAELFSRADLVFTGGQTLYEAKCDQHPAVYAFPSSIDAPHFARARSVSHDPEDQAGIPHPRLGFFGVIDERMDIELLDAVARAARLAPGAGWPRRQDRGVGTAAPPEHPLPRRQDVRRAAHISRGLGRGSAPVRAQRIDTLHQPDQDA